MYALARALQVVGLVVSGAGLWNGLLGGDVRAELVLLGAGAGVFFLGRYLQRTRR